MSPPPERLRLVYQWRKNGANISNGGGISGATTNVLAFTAAATNNDGNYSVVITNGYGSITSAVATLTVNLHFTQSSRSRRRKIRPASRTV